MRPSAPYASCSYCGGTVEEQHIRTEAWIGEHLVVFDNVPVGICSHCGEEYFRADIHDKMLLLAKTPAKQKLTVPVHVFSDAAAAKSSGKRSHRAAEEDAREEEVHIATEEELQALSETDGEENWEEL